MDGADYTRLEHFRAIAERTGEHIPELDGPDMPEIVAHVWEWFVQLGGGPLSYSEIKAWAELTRTHITPFEIELLKALEAEQQTLQHKQQSQSQTRR